jgi:GntR family transcriptional regulator / MocR family aminotransferase
MPRHLQAHELLVTIDRTRRASIGRQIEDQLRDAIRSGRLRGGTELPSTRACAEDLAVSRGVIERAYAQLAAEGYIDLRRGANPSVRDGNVRAGTSDEPCEPMRLRFDLRPHMPDVGEFPRHSWERSQRSAVVAASAADLGYGDPAGAWRVRAAVSEYLGRARGVLAGPSSTLVSAGTSSALSLLCRSLARRGATAIAFENPSQYTHHLIAARTGLDVVGIEVDEEGLDVGRLDEQAVQAVVVTSAHQFPTGCVLSDERRAALVDWARRTGGLIVEDDYDAEFRYDRSPVAALQGLAPECVAYLGSTSKTLAPALRLGWAVLPDGVFDDVRRELESTILHVPTLVQLAFADFLERGELARHVRRMRSLYRRRRDALVEALDDQLGVEPVGGIAAGLHVVVGVETYDQEARVAAGMRARRIALQTLSTHCLPGYSGTAGVLIGYGAISEASIETVVEQFADVLREEAPNCLLL